MVASSRMRASCWHDRIGEHGHIAVPPANAGTHLAVGLEEQDGFRREPDDGERSVMTAVRALTDAREVTYE